MITVIIVVHLMLAVALIGVVLLQKSEGGALGIGGGGGGMSGFLSGRSTANLLTRTTAILAAAFFATSIALAVLASSQRGPRSIIDQGPLPTAPANPSPQSQQKPAVPSGPSAPLAK